MFSVNYFMESASEDDHDLLWEERIILVEAGSEDEAKEIASTRAKSEEHSYSAEGKRIDVKLYQVDRACPIEGPLESGTELFSRFLRQSEVESLQTAFDD
jgi:hypothetical protein